MIKFPVNDCFKKPPVAFVKLTGQTLNVTLINYDDCEIEYEEKGTNDDGDFYTRGVKRFDEIVFLDRKIFHKAIEMLLLKEKK